VGGQADVADCDGWEGVGKNYGKKYDIVITHFCFLLLYVRLNFAQSGSHFLSFPFAVTVVQRLL